MADPTSAGGSPAPQTSALRSPAQIHAPLARLYAAGTTSAMLLMAAALLWPRLSPYAIGWLTALPVLAALWTAARTQRTDRRLASAALLAVVGLAAVFFGRTLLH